MKAQDLRKVSSTLPKTLHALSLCFNKMKVSDASFEFDGTRFNLFLKCYVEDHGIAWIESKSVAEDAISVVDEFYKKLVKKIDSNLEELKREENKDANQWTDNREHHVEDGFLAGITSLEMLRNVMISFQSNQ